jgi:hypothetical protein
MPFIVWGGREISGEAGSRSQRRSGRRGPCLPRKGGRSSRAPSGGRSDSAVGAAGSMSYIARVGRRCPLSPYARLMAGLTRRFHVPSALRYSSLRIEPTAARRLIADGALLIDVRRGEDRLDSPDGALRITPDAIPERLGAFSREVPIVLGCT